MSTSGDPDKGETWPCILYLVSCILDEMIFSGTALLSDMYRTDNLYSKDNEIMGLNMI